MREIRNEQLKLSAFHDQLDNGLNVYVIPREGFKQTYAMFSTKYGSIDREFVVPGADEPTIVPDGIAHFLEHKMFEQESGEDVFKTFARYGAMSNAFTSFDTTAYLFSSTDFLDENLTTLLNYVQEPYFTEENVEKEKGIIEQEIRMYDDDPAWRVYFNLIEGMYQVHPIAIDIAGTVDTIQQIDKDTLYKCYNTFYHPSNMSVVVVGDVDPVHIHALIRDNQAAKDFKRQPEIERIIQNEPTPVRRARHEEKMLISMPSMQFGFKDMSRVSGKEMIINEYATSIGLEALIGRSSPLFNRMYEEGIIDKRFSWSYDVTPRFAHSIFGGNTKDPDRVLAVVEAAFAEATEHGVSEEDFNRARCKMVGQMVAALDSARALARYFTSYTFRDADFFDIIGVMESLTLEQVNQRLREHLDPEMRTVSIVLPK
ncbi:EF-P 5-aminopentanol modification-associated protein YfmH [Tumebacillus algifaecis]|uniref:EF-P 5-aminopentanol modification-associated protein YfmH n=1 Tax=Tumebacillus algifaecis TaxID=1214604 RepID=UPI001D131ADD|nr:pitrilysin family protein [Tumebacillus algifaecis]